MRTVAATIGALLVVVPVVVAVALLATGNATDVGGLVVLAMLCAGGVHTLRSLRRTTGPEAARTTGPSRRRVPVVAVVAATVVVLVVGALAIALVMSVLGDGLRGNDLAAEIVVGLLVVAAVALVGLAARALR